VQGPHGGGGSIGSRLILSVLISVIVCLRQKEKGRGDIKASSLLLAPIPSVFFSGFALQGIHQYAVLVYSHLDHPGTHFPGPGGFFSL